MKKTNLFIIGAMKSGTTSLHNYLNAHPQIFMCEPKEPGFFVEELTWKKGVAWYSTLFNDCSNELIIGESSTHYTKRPTFDHVVEKIYDYNPDARFIYQMRDPVERAISQYWHNVRDIDFVGETRTMFDAITHDSEYINFSDYAYQLEPYIKFFGEEKIYCQTFEEMRDSPQACLVSIFDWLGVDADFIPPNLDNKWNVMAGELKQVSGKGVLNSIRHNDLWSMISPFFPSGLKELGIRMSAHNVVRNDTGLKESQQYLRDNLHPRIANLEQLLGKKYPEWKTLYEDAESSD